MLFVLVKVKIDAKSKVVEKVRAASAYLSGTEQVPSEIFVQL